jgi:hypothetical protein
VGAARAASGVVDQIRWIVESLVRERREMLATDVDPARLEANRLAIVYWQAELARRLEQGDERPPRDSRRTRLARTGR